MNARIAKKIVTCRSSLHRNPQKVRQAKRRLSTHSRFIFLWR
jgi:hypothetical protein